MLFVLGWLLGWIVTTVILMRMTLIKNSIINDDCDALMFSVALGLLFPFTLITIIVVFICKSINKKIDEVLQK